MEFNLKTDKEELETIMTTFRMIMDKGLVSDQNKATMIGSLMEVMTRNLVSKNPQHQIPSVDMLPTDEQLKMMTNDETTFQKAVDVRDTLRRMINPLYHI